MIPSLKSPTETEISWRNARFARRLAVIIILLNLALYGTVYWMLQGARSQDDLRAQTDSQNIAKVISQNLADELDKVDLVVQASRDEVTRQLASGNVDHKRLNAYLDQQKARMPELNAIRVANANGIMMYGTGVDPASRVSIAEGSHFQYMRDHADAGVVVSKARFGHVSQKWIIAVTRRYHHPDGSFAGVVSGVVELDHLMRIFNRLDVGSFGFIDMRDAELALIARSPDLNDRSLLGQHNADPELTSLIQDGAGSGTYIAASLHDGMVRTVSFNKAGGWPMYLSVGLSDEDYLSGWRAIAGRASVTSFIISVLSLFAAWLVFHYWKGRTVFIETLKHNQEMFRCLAEMSSDWIWEQDRDSRFTYIVGDLQSKFGFTSELLIGRTRWENAADADDPKWVEHRKILESHLPFQDFEYDCIDMIGRKHTFLVSGKPIFNSRGDFQGYRGITKNITERREYEERIRHMAQHDSLTLLPNRTLFYDRLEQAIKAARRKVEKFALFYIDLDQFKPVNDRFGHDTGDRVLTTVARRMQDVLRASDTLARLGGDEFAVIAFEMESAGDIKTVAQKLIDTLTAPYILTNVPDPINIGVSIGIAVFPQDSDNMSDLVKVADDAMYRAKEAGNAYYFYSSRATADGRIA